MALPHRWPLSVPSPSHGSTPCPAVKSLCLEAEKVRLCIYVSRHWVLNNKAVAWVDFLSLSVSWWAQNEQALVSAKDFLTAVKNPGPTGYHQHLSPASDLKGSSALCLASTKCIWWRWQKIAALICFCDTSRQCVIQALWHTTVGFSCLFITCFVPLLLWLLCLGYAVSSSGSLRLFKGHAGALQCGGLLTVNNHSWNMNNHSWSWYHQLALRQDITIHQSTSSTNHKMIPLPVSTINASS